MGHIGLTCFSGKVTECGRRAEKGIKTVGASSLRFEKSIDRFRSCVAQQRTRSDNDHGKSMPPARSPTPPITANQPSRKLPANVTEALELVVVRLRPSEQFIVSIVHQHTHCYVVYPNKFTNT